MHFYDVIFYHFDFLSPESVSAQDLKLNVVFFFYRKLKIYLMSQFEIDWIKNINTIGGSKSLYFKTDQNRMKSLAQTEVKNHPYCEKKKGNKRKPTMRIYKTTWHIILLRMRTSNLGKSHFSSNLTISSQQFNVNPSIQNHMNLRYGKD